MNDSIHNIAGVGDTHVLVTQLTVSKHWSQWPCLKQCLWIYLWVDGTIYTDGSPLLVSWWLRPNWDFLLSLNVVTLWLVSRVLWKDTEQVVKEFWWGHIAGGFSFGKFNVTVNCLCCQPLQMLFDSLWGNPDVRATGNHAQHHVGKSKRHSPLKCPCRLGVWTPSCVHPSPVWLCFRKGSCLDLSVVHSKEEPCCSCQSEWCCVNEFCCGSPGLSWNNGQDMHETNVVVFAGMMGGGGRNHIGRYVLIFISMPGGVWYIAISWGWKILRYFQKCRSCPTVLIFSIYVRYFRYMSDSCY